MAEPAAPLVSAQWLKEHLSDPAVVVLDVRSAIDGGGAEAYAKAHIPGAVHSDYDKAGWRVTRNGVPFMLPNKAGAREADRRNRHRRGYPRRRRAGRRAARPISAPPRGSIGRSRSRAIRRSRSSTAASPPGRRRPIRSRAARSRRRRRSSRSSSTSGCSPKSKRSSATSNATLVDARPASYFRRQGEGAGLQGLWPHSRRDQSRQRHVLRSGDQPAAPEGAARQRSPRRCRPGRWWPIATPATGRRPTGSCCRRCWAGRTCGSTTARWSNGPPIRIVRSRARARAWTI